MTRNNPAPLRRCLACGNVWSRENLQYQDSGTCPGCSSAAVEAVDEADQ